MTKAQPQESINYHPIIPINIFKLEDLLDISKIKRIYEYVQISNLEISITYLGKDLKVYRFHNHSIKTLNDDEIIKILRKPQIERFKINYY